MRPIPRDRRLCLMGDLTRARISLAISKPPSLSSAQVLRDLQHKFAPSEIFSPLLQQTRRRQEGDGHHAKRRKHQSHDNVFKMGHGGTLDPLATGILIVGIGRGTKHLNTFLGCTKTYETVVLFGKSTDTYDVAGKVVAESPYGHVTRELVEEKLADFRGEIKQVPPIYSALKIQGMKAYEYARSGKELPRELESRDMIVEECTLLDWYEGGQHDFRWPAEEASAEEKVAVTKLMSGTQGARTEASEQGKSRAVMEDLPEPSTSNTNAHGTTAALNELSPAAKAALHTHHLPTQAALPAPAPAARIRLRVSSGFYVRSFAHDLGVACGTFGIMAELVRSRQAEFTTAEPVPDGLTPTLTYADLDAGEKVWGPKISQVLEKWMSLHPDVPGEARVDDRDRPEGGGWRKKREGNRPRGGGRGGRASKRKWDDRGNSEVHSDSKIRNSSSPDV